jgi:predicted alpha/beta hydrolase
MDEPEIETVERGGDVIALHVHPAPADAPTLAVLWPAMGVPARYYRTFAAELTAAGVAVVVADLRGTGASLPRASRASAYGLGELVTDVDAVLEHLKPRRAGRRTILVGHSLGGQACALHLATENAADPTARPAADAAVQRASADAAVQRASADAAVQRAANTTENAADTTAQSAADTIARPAADTTASGGGSDVAGLVLLAVGLPYWRNYPGRQRRLAVLVQTQVLGVASAVLRVWPGWGFGGRQARGVIRDWAHSARTGRYPRLSGVDVEAGLRLVTTPVLAVDMAGDRYTPPGTVSRLLDKLSGAPVTRERYAPGAVIDHFRWAKHGGELANRIAAWARSL